MACQGSIGDYLCDGWRQRAALIRARDGERCRGCNRGADVVRLEVHHRRYGTQGGCGACVLTGVADDDLVTLCGGPDGCHEAVTNVRRALRYADREVEPIEVSAPTSARIVVTTRVEIIPEHEADPRPRGTVVSRRSGII